MILRAIYYQEQAPNLRLLNKKMTFVKCYKCVDNRYFENNRNFQSDKLNTVLPLLKILFQ